MCALYVDYPSSISVEGSFTPGPSGASPSYFTVSGATVKPEPVAADVDAHLALFAEAVGGETVDADYRNFNVLIWLQLILTRFFAVRFGLSNRGHLVVHVGDHKFIKHECYKKKIRWTCNKRIQLGCRASLTTYNSVIVRSFLEHNHS
ncbi:unnamed protein product [Euphydryas editha]|uniref:FLYWCH-type domain-containing protein n=1 Tax=Euphydryas editha TaxID=104508 RepID=A0AAU9TF84_EUPED|nr:unnamed protein product [Euphydryas editha]